VTQSLNLEAVTAARSVEKSFDTCSTLLDQASQDCVRGGADRPRHRRGGDFYTPRCVVALLVEMPERRARARIFHPCCGSGGMFIQSEKFTQAQGGQRRSSARS
jgi:hypothetical protein